MPSYRTILRIHHVPQVDKLWSNRIVNVSFQSIIYSLVAITYTETSYVCMYIYLLISDPKIKKKSEYATSNGNLYILIFDQTINMMCCGYTQHSTTVNNKTRSTHTSSTKPIDSELSKNSEMT